MNTMKFVIEVPLSLEFLSKFSMLMQIFSTEDPSKLFVELVELADAYFGETPEECTCDPECECCPLCECEEDDEEVPIEDLINGKVEVTEPTWSEVHKYLMVYIEKHKN